MTNNNKLLIISKYHSLYSEPEIGEYIYYCNKKTIQAFVSKLISITEANDTLLFINQLTKLPLLNLNSMSKKNLKLIVDCCDNMLRLNSSNQKIIQIVLNTLSKLLTIKGKKLNISLDWKLYYKIYFIETNTCYEFSISKPETNLNYIHKFYSKIVKYLTNMTKEDYDFIREESLQHLYHSRIEVGLDVLLYFAPKRFIEQDVELQEILFQLMKTNYSAMNKICKLYWVILLKNGQLKIDINEFIQYYFSYLFRYITGKTGAYSLSNYSSGKAKPNNPHKKTNSFIENICASLLFGQQFIHYRNIIDDHFKLLIPTLHLILKEKYEDQNQNKVIAFLLNITCALRYHFYTKQTKDEESQLILYLLKKIDNDLMQRYKAVLSYLNPVIHSLFLFDIKYSSIILERLFDIIVNEPFNKEIANTLRFLYENPEICNKKFIVKLACVIRNVLNKNNFKGELAFFMIDGINFMIENISSNNSMLNEDILHCLSKVYNFCSDIKEDKEYTANAHYSKLFALLNTKAIVIAKRILPIYDMLTMKLNAFSWFYSSMIAFISEDNQKLLSTEFSSYIIENELDSKYLPHYFIGVSNSKQLWQYCLESIISIEEISQNNQEQGPLKSGQVPKWFLYNLESDFCNKKYEINIHNEQRLLYYKEILSNINFNDFDLNDKTKTQFKTFIYVLLLQKDKKYHDLVFAVFNSMVQSLLQINTSNNKTGYPNDSELLYATELITQFILPYQSDLINAFNTIDDKIGKEKSQKKKREQNNSYLSQLIEGDYEKIVLIYLNYQFIFMRSFDNIFINDNKTFPITKHIDIKSVLKNTIGKYNIINQQIGVFNQFNHRLVQFNKYVPFIKNGHVIDLLYENINNQLIQIKPNKTSLDIQSNLSYAKMNFCLPTRFSHYEKLVNKQKSFRHILLFKHMADKINTVANMNLVLLAYESKIRFSNGEAFFNLLNLPEKSTVKLIKEILFRKYIKDLGKIKDRTVTDETKMDIIIGNAFALLRLLLLIRPYKHIEATNAIITIMNMLIERNYVKMNAVYPEIEKSLRVIRENMIMKYNFIENKLSAYPQISKLLIDNQTIDDNADYNTKRDKLKMTILNQLDKSKKNKASFEQQINKYIDKYFDDFYSESSLLKDTGMFMLIMLCNTLIIVNRLDINDNESIEQYDKYSRSIFNKAKENTFSYEIRKMYFDIYGMMIKHKTKAYKKYTLTQYSKEDYAKNQLEIVRNSKRFLELNDYPIKFIHKPDYDSIKPSMNESIAEFNEICNSLYSMKDWSLDKSLMKDQLGGSNLMRMFSAQRQGAGSGVNQITQTIIAKHIHSASKARQSHSIILSSSSQISKSEVLTFYYFIQHHPHLFTYERVFDYFEKYIISNMQIEGNESQVKTAIVSLICLLTILLGLIINDINKRNYSKAKQAISTVLSYYTNDINKQIDNEIISFMQLIIAKSCIKDIEMVIPFDDKSNLTAYSSELYVSIFIQIGQFFENKIYVFYKDNPHIVEYIKSIIQAYQNDHSKLISNRQKFISFIRSYLMGSQMFVYNPFTFTMDYHKDSIEFLLSLVSFNKEISDINPEVLGMVTGIVFFDSDLFLQNSNLLIKYLKPFIEFVSKKDRIFGVFNELNMIFNLSRKPIDIITLSKNLLANIALFENQKSKLMLLNTIQTLFKLNIHFNISKLTHNDLFITLVSVLESIDSELKDSFSEFFVVYYEMIKEENNKKIIDVYRSKVLNEKVEGNDYIDILNDNNISKETITYLALTQILRFRTQIPDYVQKMILDSRKYCNKMNNKGKEAKVIRSVIMKAMDRYHNAYVYLQCQISEECHYALVEISKNNSYFT